MMSVFLIAAISILILIYGVFGVRIIWPAMLARRWKVLFWFVLVACFASVPFAITARYAFPDHGITIPLSWFAYTSFGFFTLTFCAILFRDVLLTAFRGVWGIAGRCHLIFRSPVCEKRGPGSKLPNRVNSSKRLFCSTAPTWQSWAQPVF